MNRRNLLQSLGLISAHAMFPAVLSTFLQSCTNKETTEYGYTFFTPQEKDIIIETIDIIIPATHTQSASQVNTHHFLDDVFAKCLTPEQQEVIREGLAQLASGLTSATDKQKYVAEIDRRAYADDDTVGYFKTIKQYTLIGFFTSQEGTTRASNYVKIPDAYRGDIPASENTLNYGKTSLHFYL